jgi:hypothetical protein
MTRDLGHKYIEYIVCSIFSSKSPCINLIESLSEAENIQAFNHVKNMFYCKYSMGRSFQTLFIAPADICVQFRYGSLLTFQATSAHQRFP